MAQSTPLAVSWSKGMVSDVAPNLLPATAAQVLINLLPDVMNAPLTLRGAWEYAYTASDDLTDVSASSTSLSAVGHGGFIDGDQIIAIDQDGRIITIDQSGTATLLDSTGLAEASNTRPFWHIDRMIVVGSSGTKFPWAVTTDGSGNASASALSDPFPKGVIGASFEGTYLLIANGGDFANSYTLNPRRMWFSDPYLLTFTASNDSYWDWPAEVQAIVPMTRQIIGIGEKACWMLSGTTPPPNNDMVMRDLYSQGTVDRKSVELWNGYVIFANANGVWKTDGTSLVDVTSVAGIRQAWRNDMYSFGNNGAWTCAAGIFGDYYIVSILDNDGVEQATYCFDLVNQIAFKLSGFPVNMYCPVNTQSFTTPLSSLDLMFASNAVPNIGRMQPCFSTGTAAGKDANGVVIPWQLRTPFYMFGDTEEKRVRRVWVSYDWDDTSPHDDTPVASYTITNNPFTGITSLTSLTFPSVLSGRQPLFVNNKGRWVCLDFQGGSANGTHAFAFFAIDAEGRLQEASRSDST